MLTVIKGTPVITWALPVSINYGTALSAAQLNAKANVPGSGVYTPSSTTKFVTIVDGKIHAVAAGSAFITATQAGDSNWNAALPVKQLLTVQAAPVQPAPVGFVVIPAGSFQMGDQSSPLVGEANELPVHTVQVSAFYMAKNLVTKEVWDVVRTWGLSHGYTDLSEGASKAANHPVLSPGLTR